MRLAEVYERAVNWPSPRAILATLAVAALMVVVGYALSFKKRKWLGRVLGFLGFCVIMGGLFVLTERSYTERPSETITIKRFRYPERTRQFLFLTLAALPCAAAAVMWFGFVRGRYQLRGQVPRHLKAGRKLRAQKDYEGAVREYTMAIHAAPELAEAYSRRGSVYHQIGKTAEAMADLDQAIACDPRHVAAHLERAKVRTETGDFDGALADFAQLMVIRANDPDSYLQRGICLVKKGLSNEAAADFRRVLKLTNHSDFAEPAKKHLRELEIQRDRLPQPGANGVFPPLPTPAQPRAQDHAI